ncbi:MAG: hypothetical protein IKM82_06880 [Oscillospiraceae bacterium]|nr:hypothetical protein [Oscillospiraceae bacterium]MBR7074551.1 hypothetical protein [Oscillospiraceae bacterium]
MRVKHHFCCDSSRSLTDALERNGIPYAHDVWDGIRPETVTFDLYEDSTAFGEITVLAGSGDIQIREYTEQELLDAEWLTMRCFHPTLDLVREDEAFAFSEPFGDGKYRHRELVGTTFYLKKPVKWGKRHFVSDGSLGNQHLFCDPFARSALEDAHLPLRFHDVLHAKTALPLGNVFYVELLDVLPQEAIVFGGGEEKSVCESCGKIQYQIDGMYLLTIREEYLKSHVLCKTQPIFALGKYYTEPFNLISKQVYRMILENDLSRNLVFAPVTLKRT